MQRGKRCPTGNSPTSSRPTTSARSAAVSQNCRPRPPGHWTAASVKASGIGTPPPVRAAGRPWSAGSTPCRGPAANAPKSRCVGRPAAVRTLHNQPLLWTGPRRVQVWYTPASPRRVALPATERHPLYLADADRQVKHGEGFRAGCDTTVVHLLTLLSLVLCLATAALWILSFRERNTLIAGWGHRQLQANVGPSCLAATWQYNYLRRPTLDF